MTEKEIIMMIRAELKKIGYSSRQVSVRSGNCSYNKSVKIVIKDDSCNVEKIKSVALKFKSIDYDERTGEILSGGNVYISVCKKTQYGTITA